MAEKFKQVTIKDRDYRISKWGAALGSYMVVKVGGIVGPMVASIAQGVDPAKFQSLKPSDIDLRQIDFSAIFGALANLSEDDFSYIQTKCLSVCAVRLQSGYQNVMHDNGEFSIAELDDDPMTVMALMVHAITHNLSGFFSDSPLSGFLSGMLDTNSQS